MSQGPRGMLAAAIALATGAVMHQDAKNAFMSQQIGNHMLMNLKYHYKGVGGRGASNAAALKRASKKRRNIAKHPRAKHRQGNGYKMIAGKRCS